MKLGSRSGTAHPPRKKVRESNTVRPPPTTFPASTTPLEWTRQMPSSKGCTNPVKRKSNGSRAARSVVQTKTTRRKPTTCPAIREHQSTTPVQRTTRTPQRPSKPQPKPQNRPQLSSTGPWSTCEPPQQATRLRAQAGVQHASRVNVPNSGGNGSQASVPGLSER